MKLSSRIAARHITAAAKNLTLSSKSSSFKQHKSIIMTSLVSNTSCQEQRHMVQRRHHSQYQIMNQSLSESPPPPPPAAAPSIIITPPPSPQLLLEGDEMYISSDGKSHTYYRLHHPAASAGSNQNSRNEYVLEEAYDIEHARKEITLLLQHSADSDDDMSTSSTPPTPTPQQHQQPIKQITFPLQEISNGIQSGAGTGSTTWDSSIVMGLYFGMHPDQLVGDVLELGSGVGLGGILTGVVVSNNADSDGGWNGNCEKKKKQRGGGTVTSLTLSEINTDVIHMLRYNTAVAADVIVASASNNDDTTRSVGLLGCDTKLHIDTLDWFDFVSGGMSVPNDDHSTAATTATAATNDTTTTRRKKYDTIIASDCIYRLSQVQPISNTIATLLKRQRGGDSPTNDDPQQAAVAHIFSPYNRGFIQNLIQELRDGKGLIVTADTIEMDIVRVKKEFHDDDGSENTVEDVPLMNWLLGNGNDDAKKKSKRYNDVMMSSSRTSKFLHITASFKEDDRVKDENPLDESMTSID